MSPSPSQLAALVVATAAAASTAHAVNSDSLASDRRTVALFIIDSAAQHAATCDIRRLDRRLTVHAASWANRYLRSFTRPAAVTPLNLDTAGLAALDLSSSAAALQRSLLADAPGAAGGAHPLDVRLLHHAGSGALVLDQLTHAHSPAAVGTDDFARRALAAHFALGVELTGFAGVRLLAPRIPFASLHYPTPTSSHPLGGCPTCTSTETSR